MEVRKQKANDKEEWVPVVKEVKDLRRPPDDVMCIQWRSHLSVCPACFDSKRARWVFIKFYKPYETYTAGGQLVVLFFEFR